MRGKCDGKGRRASEASFVDGRKSDVQVQEASLAIAVVSLELRESLLPKPFSQQARKELVYRFLDLSIFPLRSFELVVVCSSTREGGRNYRKIDE